MSDQDDMPESASADAESPLEPWLQLLADDYHRPPPAPREAMWARIKAARAVAAQPPVDAADDNANDHDAIVVAAPTPRAGFATGDDLAGRRAGRGTTAGTNRRYLPSAWSGPSLGIAAALLLAAGLGWWTRTPAVPAADAPATPVAVVPGDRAPTNTLGSVSSSTPADGPMPAPARAGLSVPRSTIAAVAPRATTVDRDRAAASPTAGRLVASADDGRGGDGDEGDDGLPGEQSATSAPYRLAAAQHLGQAEALLTVFRAESTLDTADPSLQRWARELLTTTRLLLDSPAARDQRLGALLDELEPVLVQIVQLPAARVAEERQLIARSLERSDLLTQLRSVVPAGPAVPQRAGE